MPIWPGSRGDIVREIEETVPAGQSTEAVRRFVKDESSDPLWQKG
jgi:hypothetical protein